MPNCNVQKFIPTLGGGISTLPRPRTHMLGEEEHYHDITYHYTRQCLQL